MRRWKAEGKKMCPAKKKRFWNINCEHTCIVWLILCIQWKFSLHCFSHCPLGQLISGKATVLYQQWAEQSAHKNRIKLLCFRRPNYSIDRPIPENRAECNCTQKSLSFHICTSIWMSSCGVSGSAVGDQGGSLHSPVLWFAWPVFMGMARGVPSIMLTAVCGGGEST